MNDLLSGTAALAMTTAMATAWCVAQAIAEQRRGAIRRRMASPVGVNRTNGARGSRRWSVGALTWWPWWSKRRERQVSGAVEAQLAGLCEAVARELQAGSALSIALWAAAERCGGPVADDLASARRQVDGGTPLIDALEAWALRRGASATMVVGAVSIGLELGGELAAAFEALGGGLRDRDELAAEIGSLTAQSRASATLLTGLPLFAATGLALLNPPSGHFLVGTGTGLACVAAAATADAGGWLWMRAMMRGAQ